jgi:hypothetical protein
MVNGGGAPQGVPQGSGVTTYPLQGSPDQSPQQPMSGGLPYLTPQAEMGFALAGKKDVSEVIHRQMQITQGPQGTLFRNGQVIGQAKPDGYILFEGGDMSKPKFYANPAELNAAAAAQAGAIKGSETAAAKAAEFPYQTTTATGPGNAPISGYTANVYGPPPVPGQQPAQSPQGGPRINFNGLTIDQAMAALKDAQQPGGPAGIPSGGSVGNGVVRGESPVAIKAAEERILTNEQRTRGANSTMQQNSQTMYEDIRKKHDGRTLSEESCGEHGEERQG